MKRLTAVVLTALCLICGCGGNDNVIRVGFEAGEICHEEVKTAISDYYSGKEVVFSEAERGELSADEYNAVVKYVNMTASLGFEVNKSKVIKYESLCSAAYEDYRISYDFSGKKAALYGDFSLNELAPVVEDCVYTEYTDSELMLSDLREGAVDVILCLSDSADELKAADPKLRINDMLESGIYEYVVVSEDSGLIAETDKVIGD
ncbi:MAG: hypothetical protein LUG66_02690 [Clostridiales bacterium]|nr:hypothetical protein [Clostridiales bacterium]